MSDPAPKMISDTHDAYLGIQTSANGQIWKRRAFSPRDVETIVQREGLHPAVAEVLSARGVGLDDVHDYLNPSLKKALPDPFLLKGMEQAVMTIADTVMAGETIGIFGDYDVDGTTSSALLYRYFKAMDVPVRVHLPDRQAEGYGPNLPAFHGLIHEGASLILTVDCGATAHQVLSDAQVQGMRVIVLDHHLMDAIPPAVAVVNPQRADDLSGLTGLSAGGVTFMAMVALNRELRQRGLFENRDEPKLLQWLDLVALSLVCDVMPLTGLTRILVRQGLRLLQNFDDAQTGNPGIRALAILAGAKGTPQAYHFGYAIGPRINATGRIGHAKLAFDLLTEDNPANVMQMAEHLQSLNGARQGVEQSVQDEAIRQAEAKGGRDSDAPLIVANEGWHPGVIGIVAGRLKERFKRPAIVISFEGDEGKGSGRSLGGVDLGAAISAAVEAGVISGGGGHPMAAGLSLTKEQLPAFETFLAQQIGAQTATARANQSLWLDGSVSVGAMTKSFHDQLEAVGPFGNGNPEPRFVAENVRITSHRVLKEKHFSCSFQDGMGRTARAICFGVIGSPLGDFLLAAAEGAPVHLAGKIKPDDWRGGDAGQFHIEDGAWA